MTKAKGRMKTDHQSGKKVVRRTRQRIPNPDNRGHEHVELARLDPLDAPQAQLSRFGQLLLGHFAADSEPPKVCTEGFLEGGDLVGGRHPSFKSSDAP